MSYVEFIEVRNWQILSLTYIGASTHWFMSCVIYGGLAMCAHKPCYLSTRFIFILGPFNLGVVSTKPFILGLHNRSQTEIGAPTGCPDGFCKHILHKYAHEDSKCFMHLKDMALKAPDSEYHGHMKPSNVISVFWSRQNTTRDTFIITKTAFDLVMFSGIFNLSTFMPANLHGCNDIVSVIHFNMDYLPLIISRVVSWENNLQCSPSLWSTTFEWLTSWYVKYWKLDVYNCLPWLSYRSWLKWLKTQRGLRL